MELSDVAVVTGGGLGAGCEEEDDDVDETSPTAAMFAVWTVWANVVVVSADPVETRGDGNVFDGDDDNDELTLLLVVLASELSLDDAVDDDDDDNDEGPVDVDVVLSSFSTSNCLSSCLFPISLLFLPDRFVFSLI